jgi:Holliday junction resolvase
MAEPVNGRGQYQRGTALENRVRKRLEANGYFVIRSAGSKTPVDLVAIKRGQILFIQCKRGGNLPAPEWNALYDAATDSGALAVLAEQLVRGQRYWLLTGMKRARQRANLAREELRIDLQ